MLSPVGRPTTASFAGWDAVAVNMNAESGSPLVDERLAPIAGGWRSQSVDVGWRRIELAIPVDPDTLLGDEQVLAANQRDDYMPYWASLWPAASKTAAALQWAPWPAGTRVLELGCGLGLVGIAGLCRGWSVVMTDYEPAAMRAAAFNAEQNGFSEVETRLLDWREPCEQSFPVILACDVLYERRSHAPLLSLLPRMLSEGGCCWLGDPGRTPIVDFYHTAVEAGYRVRILSDQGRVESFPVRGQFQLLQLTLPGDRRPTPAVPE